MQFKVFMRNYSVFEKHKNQASHKSSNYVEITFAFCSFSCIPQMTILLSTITLQISAA